MSDGVEIKNGTIWERKNRTNGIDTQVEVIDTTLKTKAPADANWHDAVEYLDSEDQGFVRTRADFIDKYEEVDDGQDDLPTI